MDKIGEMRRVVVVDETTAGARVEGLVLEFFAPKITVRTLIESRIAAEVESHAAERLEARGGWTALVTPSAGVSRVDVGKQVETAVRAFETGRLLVLLPGGQAESLEDTLSLEEDAEVTFLRLVPLVGG